MSLRGTPRTVVAAASCAAALLVIAAVVLVVVRRDGSSGSRPGATRAALPVGGVVSLWELPVGEYYGTAIDERSGSIVLTDDSGGLDEPDRLQVVDSVRGTVRWAITADVTWVRNPDGTLATTASGLAFQTTESPYGDYLVYGVRLSTGKRAWRAQPSAYGSPRLVGDLLALETGAGIIALDANTGAERWQWTADGGCGADGPELDEEESDRPKLDEEDSDGITARCEGALFRIDVADGSTAWRWSAQEGCLIRDESSAAGIVAVSVTCDDDQSLRVFDGGSGTQRWSQPIKWDPEEGAAGVAVVMAGKAPMVAAFGPGEVYTASTGKPVPLAPDSVPVRYVGGPGPDGLLLQRDDGGRLVLSLVDPTTGHVSWERALPFPGEHNLDGTGTSPYRFAGGILYVVGAVPLLWPAVIALVDGQSGAMTLSATGRGDVDLVGTGVDGTLYLTYGPHGQSRLTALRVTGRSSGFLGTRVSADQWPDACRLLSAAQYRSAYPGVTPALRPEPSNLPGAELPAPPRCHYFPPSINGTEVTVSVNWLADAADEARRVVDKQTSENTVAVTVGNKQHPALQWDATNPGIDLMKLVRLSISVGRCVATVETLGDSTPLRALGGSVADSLADPAVSPGCSA